MTIHTDSPAAAARFALGPAVSAPAIPTIGEWELIFPLSASELTRVYLARPAHSRATTAGYVVKLLGEAWQEDVRALEMLRREARLGRKLSHPHLVPVLAASLHQQPCYLVMPRLRGATLADRLMKKGTPQLPTALWIARQVAEALGALHAAGWMHADVKPSNIFVGPEGHATLLDLGFARQMHEMNALADRPVLGTLNYLAPEMLVQKLPADIRSDIYSLGVTLFEMLTGRLPFDARDVAELALQHRQAIPAELRVLEPRVPTRVARLVHQMLAKEPLRRPQNPTELISRLTALEIETFAERGP